MNNLIKSFFSLLLLIGFTASVSAADYNFKFGTVSADTEPLLDAMRYMAKNIEDRSNGRIEIDVFDIENGVFDAKTRTSTSSTAFSTLKSMLPTSKTVFAI